MTDIVAIASNAVAAYQRALSTTSNNIANVATVGYSRQEVALQANPVIREGNLYMGSGVAVDFIKRNYNAFIESNLRNSFSDLASQEPMVSYANRVVDVMGGETMGLTSALDQFFSSARSLSADPASTVLRGSFVRDAQGAASRFQELSSQLDLVQEETTQALKGSVEQINTLTGQLARVNQQLAGQRTEAAQAPELLDQRDLLLKNLSGFTRTNTRFETNGTVTVSLGSSINTDIVVQGNKSMQLGTNFNAAAPEKVSLVLDPYGKPSTLAGITSGQLAGLMAFREQVLGSTRAALDKLAKTFAAEVNAVHQGGIDGYGNTAGALFKFDPAAATAAGGLRVVFDDPLKVSAAAQFRVIEEANNPGNAKASLLYEQPKSVGGAPDLPLALVNNDHPSAAKTYTLDTTSPYASIATVANGMQDVGIFLDSMAPGQQLQILTRDGRQIMGTVLDSATVAQLFSTDNGFAAGATYSPNYLNTSDTLGYKGMNVFYGAQADVRLEPMFDSKGIAMSPKPLPALLQGTRMAMAANSGIAANTLTLNGTALGALAAPNDGTPLQAGAIAAWINTVQGTTGVTATASNEIRGTDDQLKLTLPLAINGVVIPPTVGGYASKAVLIDAINGQTGATGVTANLAADGAMVLRTTNGQDIAISTDLTGVNTLGNALGLTAGTFTGSVSLTRSQTVETTKTDLNGKTFKITEWNGNRDPIKLGFGSNGTPTDLAQLGFRTGATIQGAAKDDLLVFVTGAGTATVSARYAGTPVDAKQSLRAQPMTLTFTSATSYTITDKNTGTVVAERIFDPLKLEPGVQYQGLQLSFTSPPKSGDIFVMDNNRDGTGNNSNMLALAALEQKAMVGNKTLSGAYLDHVNDMGNIARQASIAKTALKVVNDQATVARNDIAGVSLDQEAADLIRFQQAYQAAAKVLQIAGTLFDNVLQLR
jgi:flagellar hook-associated protein FlgK